jgi:hypothetical protein
MSLDTSNSYRLWTMIDILTLESILDKKKIDLNDIKNIANQLKRTENAIISRLLKFYVANEFNFITCDNEKIYKKFSFYSEKEIDNYLINNFTKKRKINFKLHKINYIMINLIIDNNDYHNSYEKVIELVKEIKELNNN